MINDTENLSTINIFLAALKSEGFRSIVSKRFKELNLPPPYDQLCLKLCGIEGDIEHRDFISLCYTYLNPSDVSTLETLTDSIGSGIAIQSLEILLGLGVLDRIGLILKRDSTIDKKIESIGTLIESARLKSGEPKAKKFNQLEVDIQPHLFKWLRYPVRRGKLYLMAAYSGVGKTNLSLSLAKQAGRQGFNVHYISIADWSESEIRNKIEVVKDFPDIWLSIFDDASVYDIEQEIEQTKPDICIVDSLTDLNSYSTSTEEYFWEIERKARQLRRLATKYNLVMFTTHQLIVRDERVLAEDLLGAKAHLLKVVDLAWGIGCMDRDGNNTVSTLKLRHDKSEGDFKISIDVEGLFIHSPKTT